MNPKPFLFALSTVATLLFTACQKDKEDDNTPDDDVNEEFVMPTGEPAKVMGKWQVGSITVNNHFAGEDHIETYTGTAADYADFKSTGKLHTFFGGTLDVSNFTVRSASQITIDGDLADVKVLSDSKMVIYDKDKTGTFGFTEITYDLKK
jgi:hypothetical protein